MKTKIFLYAALSLVLGACSNSSSTGPDEDEQEETKVSFVQNDDEWLGFYKTDGYKAFLQMAYKSEAEIGASYLVKFIITDFDTDSAEVHFMNTARHQLHYEFARDILKDSRSRTEYEKETYLSPQKNTAAGTLVYYPTIDSLIGLTFFPTDLITPEQVEKVYTLIQDRMLFLSKKSDKNRLFYMPAGSDAEKAAANYRKTFEARDVLVYTHAELFGNIPFQIMNKGTAYGTLRKLTAKELDTAIVSMHDILILETLPAEIPLVAGSISKDAQTSLSHVNLAAKARKTPNIAFNGNDLPDSLLALNGKLVKLAATTDTYTIEETSIEEAKDFWNKNARKEMKLTYDLSDSGLVDFKDMNFSSAKSVGVKVANLAELHKVIPDNSPDGFGVPFYHYSNFLNYTTVDKEMCEESFLDCKLESRSVTICKQVHNICTETAKEGTSLRNYISTIIKRDDFTVDARLREATLDNFIYIFKHSPVEKSFGEALDAKVFGMFGDASVRLRSSTNSEDLADFNGAGLYESYKATRKQGDYPSDEIPKVWASVWTYKAFEERTLWNIDHMSVQMAVAVHKGFPDELANGVIITQNIADLSVAGIYVNMQVGELSITNPEGGERPEKLSIIPSANGVQSVITQYSTLSPNRSILTEKETLELYRLVMKAQYYFAELYKKNPDSFALDLEFKLMKDGSGRKLFLKQIRPYIM